MSVTFLHFLGLGFIVFSLGLVGVAVNRKNLIRTLLSVELMFLGTMLVFVAAGHMRSDIQGQVFALFLLAIAAAEAAVGLAIIVVMYRQHKSVSFEKIERLKG
tara:strand:- start:597 stop:905 length:309 start_codon:yes stop_codon:yes gene_type:complete